MKKLTNLKHKPPSGYELFMNAIDTFGRKWKYMVYPICGGSVGYFCCLTDYLHWCKQVNEIRNFQY